MASYPREKEEFHDNWQRINKSMMSWVSCASVKVTALLRA